MDFQKGFSQPGLYGAVNGICICDFSTCSPIIPIAAVQTWSRWQMVLIKSESGCRARQGCFHKLTRLHNAEPYCHQFSRWKIPFYLPAIFPSATRLTALFSAAGSREYLQTCNHYGRLQIINADFVLQGDMKNCHHDASPISAPETCMKKNWLNHGR